MKIRNGFVSNSSSSSFIVAISKDYKPGEIAKALLNIHSQWGDWMDEGYDKDEVAKEAEGLMLDAARNGLKIESFKAGVGHVDNESGDAYSLLHTIGELSGKGFKFLNQGE